MNSLLATLGSGGVVTAAIVFALLAGAAAWLAWAQLRITSKALRQASRLIDEFEQVGRGWFWETDSDGLLTYVSDALATAFYLPPHELRGTPLSDLMLTDEARLQAMLWDGTPFQGLPARANTQNECWWSLSGTPLFGDEGELLGFRGFATALHTLPLQVPATAEFPPEPAYDPEREALTHDLRTALHRNQMQLLFQPVVRATNEELVGFEALLRWLHPERGAIGPEQFVPLAEESGLIDRIGEWVIRGACLEASHWPSHVRVAVNLSAVQFANPALPGIIAQALDEAAIDPRRLELEITESVLLADTPGTEEMFASLKAIGVRLVLDDFGTGYSSLSYLQRAPFDKIKIDRSFVAGAAPGTRSSAIVRAIVTLAESLGMASTAEGVETKEEHQLVRGLGCTEAQGHLFGRAMSAEEAMRLATEVPEKREAAVRSVREQVVQIAALRWNGETLPVRLRNISAGGALLETDKRLEPGLLVELDVPGAGTVVGDVRWSQAGRIGIRFHEEFDLRRLAAERKREPVMKRPIAEQAA